LRFVAYVKNKDRTINTNEIKTFWNNNETISRFTDERRKVDRQIYFQRYFVVWE